MLRYVVYYLSTSVEDINRGVAQLVEQRSPKPRALGSSPSTPAEKITQNISVCVIFFALIICLFISIRIYLNLSRRRVGGKTVNCS